MHLVAAMIVLYLGTFLVGLAIIWFVLWPLVNFITRMIGKKRRGDTVETIGGRGPLRPKGKGQAGIATVISLIATVYFADALTKFFSGELVLAEKKTIAVVQLNEALLTGDQRIEVDSFDYSLQLAVDLISSLGKDPELEMLSPDTSLQFHTESWDSFPDFYRLTKDLGVNYVILGDVTKDADRVYLDLRMYDVARGVRKFVWFGEFGAGQDEVSALIEDVRSCIRITFSLAPYDESDCSGNWPTSLWKQLSGAD